MTRGFGETLWGASSHPIEGIRVSRQEGRRRRESRHFCSNGSDGEMDLHVPYSDETIFRGSEHSTDVIFHAVELTVADRRFREDDTRDSLRVFPHRQVLSGEEVRQRQRERETNQMDPLHVVHQIKDSNRSIGGATKDPILMVQEKRDGARVASDLVQGLSCVHVAHKDSSVSPREESLADDGN
jgi:hypothetical protein